MAAPATCDYRTLRLAPLTPTIGVEIEGVRMSGDVSPEQIAEIRRALLDWKVVFFRGQDVTRDEHVAFGRLFGELEVHPFTPNHPEHPEMVVIHNDERTKRGQNNWHSDVTWRQEPSLGSILRALVLPPLGGDTLFADMHAAYEGLRDEIKQKIEGRRAVHSFTHNFGRRMDAAQLDRMRAQYPDAVHPVVRTHPETGARSLYVNRAFTTHIEDMEPEESRRLLSLLYRQASVPEYQCRFRWQLHSVAFWDNRAAQHYAAFDYHPHTRRVERVTIAGDRPR
jgi:taurine dioxygenase